MQNHDFEGGWDLGRHLRNLQHGGDRQPKTAQNGVRNDVVPRRS